MIERTTTWQAIAAIVISGLVLGLLAATAFFAERVDHSLGHGPLPSGLTPSNAYLATLLLTATAIVAGGATLAGVRQAKFVTKRFAWLVYALVGIPLLLLLLTPMQRHGSDGFVGLPDFLLGPPGRMAIAVTLGALLLGWIDIRRVPGIGGPRPMEVGTGGQSLRGLPGRFTPSAWRVLSMMQEEARRFEHAYMGTEHLLLAITREERSVGARALVNLGVELAGLRTQIEGVIGRRGSLYTGTTGMTRKAQRVIEQASRRARSDSTRLVSTGHLLTMLVESPDDVAGQLLEQQGVTADRLAIELRHLGPETT